jgi:hypothetical protein
VEGALELLKLRFKVCAELLTASKRRKTRTKREERTNEKRGTDFKIEPLFLFFSSFLIDRRDTPSPAFPSVNEGQGSSHCRWVPLPPAAEPTGFARHLLLATPSRSRRNVLFPWLLPLPGPAHRQSAAGYPRIAIGGGPTAHDSPPYTYWCSLKANLAFL